MNNHQELESMLEYIHASIKRDLEHHILMNRISLGLSPNIKSKININSVIWWNRPIVLYAIKKLKEYELDKYPYDYDWSFISAYCRIFKLDQGKDMMPWGEALRYFGRNYTEDLKVSKWNISYITKEMWPDMTDDEIRYANDMWNRIFGDKPYTKENIKKLFTLEPDPYLNDMRTSWLERKTKRRK